jgi:hypothetical protein
MNKLLGGEGLSQWISSAMVDIIPMVNMTVHYYLFLLLLSLFVCLQMIKDTKNDQEMKNQGCSWFLV